MKTEETVYRELYAELEKYERKGVNMLIDGYQASPLQIVAAYMAKEEATYILDSSYNSAYMFHLLFPYTPLRT